MGRGLARKTIPFSDLRVGDRVLLSGNQPWQVVSIDRVEHGRYAPSLELRNPLLGNPGRNHCSAVDSDQIVVIVPKTSQHSKGSK